MKTKHITRGIILNALILSASCSGMNYMSSAYNSTTNLIKTNMVEARIWTSNFFKSCWNIGILATLYAKMGMYDFKRISGLDENRLDTYDNDQLKDAQRRVEKMIQYSSPSLSTLNTLNEFSTKIQGIIIQKEHDAHVAAEEAKRLEEGFTPEQISALKDVSKILNKK
jgi:hypothetical protein